MSDSSQFFQDYSSTLNTSRQILLNIIRLLHAQEDTIQRNMILQTNSNLRRELETPLIFPRRTPRTPIRSRTWRNVSQPNNSNLSSNNNSNSNTNITDILNSAFSDILDNNDVIIRPSPEIIRRATENILFSDLNDDIQRYQTCPISHEPFTENSPIIRIRHCRHYFSRPAFHTWFENHVHCPICRHDIRENLPIAINNENGGTSISQPTQINTPVNVHMSEASGNNIQDFINVISNDINENGLLRSNTVSYQFDFNSNPNNSNLNSYNIPSQASNDTENVNENDIDNSNLNSNNMI